jgi:hypothetical protein
MASRTGYADAARRACFAPAAVHSCRIAATCPGTPCQFGLSGQLGGQSCSRNQICRLCIPVNDDVGRRARDRGSAIFAAGGPRGSPGAVAALVVLAVGAPAGEEVSRSWCVAVGGGRVGDKAHLGCAGRVSPLRNFGLAAGWQSRAWLNRRSPAAAACPAAWLAGGIRELPESGARRRSASVRCTRAGLRANLGDVPVAVLSALGRAMSRVCASGGPC